MKENVKEKDVQNGILMWLNFMGCITWRQNQGAVVAEHKGKKRFFRMTSLPGISDIIGLLPGGRFIAIEVKRPGWRPNSRWRNSPQAKFIDLVNQKGGLAFVATSVDEVIERVAPHLKASGVEVPDDILIKAEGTD